MRFSYPLRALLILIILISGLLPQRNSISLAQADRILNVSLELQNDQGKGFFSSDDLDNNEIVVYVESRLID